MESSGGFGFWHDLDSVAKFDTVDDFRHLVLTLQSSPVTLESRGISLRATEQDINTSTPAGRAFLQMLGVFSEFETAIRRERQMEGIASAKAKGVYKGRTKAIDPGKVQALKAEGLGITEIANQLKISRQSVYRVLS